MAYVPTLVALGGALATNVGESVGNHGMPASCNYLLMSFWLCLGADLHARDFQFSARNVQITPAQPISGSNSVFINLGSGTLSPWWHDFHNHDWLGDITHVLISADCVSGIVQLYCNDVAVPPNAGGLTGHAPGPFLPSNAGFIWDAASAPPGTGMGDFFLAAPSSFFDLTVVANRRKFINADLSPVDLGADGSGPLLSVPPIFMTARSGVAADFANNNGTGGGFPINRGPLGLLPDGTCNVAWPPPPPPTPPSLALDNLLCTGEITRRVEGRQVFLDWSDDRGHTFGNPVGQPIGERGDYPTNVQWQRLGYARDRVFRLTWSVPVATALQGAFLELDKSATR